MGSTLEKTKNKQTNKQKGVLQKTGKPRIELCGTLPFRGWGVQDESAKNEKEGLWVGGKPQRMVFWKPNEDVS